MDDCLRPAVGVAFESRSVNAEAHAAGSNSSTPARAGRLEENLATFVQRPGAPAWRTICGMSNQPEEKSDSIDVQATIEALYNLLGDDAPPRPDHPGNAEAPAELSQEERPHPVRDRILLRY